MDKLCKIDDLLWRKYYREAFKLHLGIDIEGVPEEPSAIEYLRRQRPNEYEDALKRLTYFKSTTAPSSRLDLFGVDVLNKKNQIRVLDFGCGSGQFSRFLASRFSDRVEVVGFDPIGGFDVGGLANLKSKTDWTQVAAEKGFDLIVAFYVMHHIELGELDLWIRRIREVLAENGEIWILEDIAPFDALKLGSVSVDSRELYVRNEYWANEWTYGVELNVFPESYFSTARIKEQFQWLRGDCIFHSFSEALKCRLHPLPFVSCRLW